uniref:Uncharacterized protein n=1 Tax=viral metagenome TaxID=1070528 RepID=A0A6C0JSD8_9ZZZZ
MNTLTIKGKHLFVTPYFVKVGKFPESKFELTLWFFYNNEEVDDNDYKNEEFDDNLRQAIFYDKLSEYEKSLVTGIDCIEILFCENIRMNFVTFCKLLFAFYYRNENDLPKGESDECDECEAIFKYFNRPLDIIIQDVDSDYREQFKNNLIESDLLSHFNELHD